MRVPFSAYVASLLLAGGWAAAGASEPSTSAQAGPGVCADQVVAEVVVAPTQPDIALRIRVFRKIWVDVVIDPEGNVAETTVRLDSLNEKDMLDLGKISEVAARRWRFNSAPNCGSRRATLTFDFQQPVPIGQPGGTVFRPPFTVEIFREDIRFDVKPIYN